jgi:anti-sigma factor RsiW
MTMGNEEERFEADLRAALAPEPASLALRQRVLAQAVQENRTAKGALPGWLAALDPRGWRLLELGSLAAAASLAIGIFAGASGLVPDSSGTAATVASNDSSTVDLVALAYDDSGISGDLQ